MTNTANNTTPSNYSLNIMDTTGSIEDLTAKAYYYMNELVYLMPNLEVEKAQAQKFISKLANLTEVLEIKGARESLITLCWNSVTHGSTKFK